MEILELERVPVMSCTGKKKRLRLPEKSLFGSWQDGGLGWQGPGFGPWDTANMAGSWMSGGEGATKTTFLKC